MNTVAFLTFPTQCHSVQSAIASRSEKTKLSSENKIKSQRVQLSGVRKRLTKNKYWIRKLAYSLEGIKPMLIIYVLHSVKDMVGR